MLWLLPWLGPHVFFEGESIDTVLMLRATGYQLGQLCMIPPTAQQMEHWYRDDVFIVTISIVLWNIWRARCLHVLGHTQPSTCDTVVMIWLDLISLLRSMYDDSCWSSIDSSG